MPILETNAGRLSYFDNGYMEADAPTLLLLHSSGASHRQWRALIAQLPQSWRILAPDLFGYGGTPMPQPAAGEHQSIVQDELDLLGALLHQQTQGPVHVIGHSYGGAVALELALRHPARIAALAAYEPVMFALLRDSEQRAAWREITAVAQRVVALAGAGDLNAAASVFIDYWTTYGAFAAMPEAMQATAAAGMSKVAAEFGDMLRWSGTTPDFSVLTMPLLLLTGSDTTLAVRGVMAELRRLLPEAQYRILPAATHMAPLLQPDLVNPLLLDFLQGAVQATGGGLRHTG